MLVFWTVLFQMVFLMFLFFTQVFPVWQGMDWYVGSPRWDDGALVYFPIIGRGPGEDESIGGEGPSDVFALSPFICPSVREFV